MSVVCSSTYIKSDKLLQTWDLYLQKWCRTQKLGNNNNNNKKQDQEDKTLKQTTSSILGILGFFFVVSETIIQ